jgi:hypothetical protein
MSRRRGLFEVVIGLVIIVLFIPLIMISIVTGYVAPSVVPSYGFTFMPSASVLIAGPIGVFLGVVLIIDGLRRSILRGREIAELKEYNGLY